MSSILYRYGGNHYINLTNRCPCDCTFCYRYLHDSIGESETLWLEKEPTVDDVMDAIREAGLTKDNHIVFCGFGEPTVRIEELKEISKRIRAEVGADIRLDTNGLGRLIHGRDILPEIAESVDAISISLNACNAEEYGKVTRCTFDQSSPEYGRLLRGGASCFTISSVAAPNVPPCKAPAFAKAMAGKLAATVAAPPIKSRLVISSLLERVAKTFRRALR